MIISIRESSEIPIFQQIHNQIIQGISDGRLKPGEQLPTVRAFADEMGINAMTVSKGISTPKAGRLHSGGPQKRRQGSGRFLPGKGTIPLKQRAFTADRLRGKAGRHVQRGFPGAVRTAVSHGTAQTEVSHQ